MRALLKIRSCFSFLSSCHLLILSSCPLVPLSAAETSEKTAKELLPKTVTLKEPAIPLSKALEQLHKQTGIRVIDRSQAKNPMLKLDLQKAVFWQALDAIAQGANLNISWHEEDGQIALRPGPHRQLPVCHSGLFRIEVQRIAAVRDLAEAAHLCTVDLAIAWEPGYRPLFFQTGSDSLVVQDDQGRPLKVQAKGSGRSPPSARNTTLVKVVLEAPAREVRSLGLVKGSYRAILPNKMLDFTFEKLAAVDRKTPPAKVPSQSREGVTVKLREFKAETGLWTACFQLDYPPDGPDFESFESWLENNELHLVGKNGKRLAATGFEIDEQSAHRATITYRFVEGKDVILGKPEESKLVYHTPGRIVTAPIPFEFKNLPLP